MFFKKLFSKDYRHYLEKGEKYFGEERYADARHAFQEALEKMGADEGGAAGAEIKGRISETGNRLALLNLAEAEHAAARGDFAKADEHLRLVLEFAEDPGIRGKAEQQISSLAPAAAPVDAPQAKQHCGGCATDASAAASDEDLSASHLSDRERYELLVQTLPASLAQRYAVLGENFVRAYLLVHDGNDRDGFTIYQELLKEGENDILLYEVALLLFRNGNPPECERLLRRALALNDMNPLCCLGLVQLLTDAGRFEEAIPLLNYMIERQLLTEQAVIFLGDVQQRQGNEGEAMSSYTKALEYPAAAKAAAERLVPLLQNQGRGEEALYLAKRYLKGCC